MVKNNNKITLLNQKEPIAIVGIGCRFPGNITNPETFWEFLVKGGDGISEVPADRWNLQKFYDPDRSKKGKIYTRKGGFLENLDKFDPQFFGISPREANYIDPQQRLLLEVTWEALENGGIIPENLAGENVGVYVGLFMHDYENIHTGRDENKLYGYHSATGTSTSIAANRISYCFNFNGPSMVVDTACSSSLTAVHLACKSLLENESKVAVAGGVNSIIRPENTLLLCEAQMLSPDGYCKSFDARADGYARAEGAGMVVLKKLSDAVADGNSIYAVIRGSAVNQDGHSDGLTVPSQRSQEKVLNDALKNSGVRSDQIKYIETHGTGTAVGDPIEANALGKVVAKYRKTGDECIIGSVKSNFGHTESAAGVAGLIKTALILQHGKIPPNLHFETPNPKIPFEKLKLRVPTKLETWPDDKKQNRFAGVNSFGFGGSNAHVILENFSKKSSNKLSKKSKEKTWLIPLSAKSDSALRDVVKDHLKIVAADKNLKLENIGFTSALKKGHHDFRLAVAAKSTDEYFDSLDAFLKDENRKNVVTGTNIHFKKCAFVFSGMGQQYNKMGQQLFQNEPVFKKAIEKCDSVFKKLDVDWSKNVPQSIFSIQVALSKLWKSRGVVPEMIVGHSIGEIAAAHVAGILSLEDAVKICFHRSRLLGKIAGSGSMLAVGLSENELKKVVRDKCKLNNVFVAAINSQNSVTLSGTDSDLKYIYSVLEKEKVFLKFLNVNIPFHCPIISPILDELKKSLTGIRPLQASIPFISTVTGKLINGTELDETYWCRNVSEPVSFLPAVNELIKSGVQAFIEISAHPVLTSSINEIVNSEEIKSCVVPSLKRNESEQLVMLSSAGKLYCNGFPVDWKLFYPEGGTFINLPSYPWQKERFWTESDESKNLRLGNSNFNAEEKNGHPLLGCRQASALPTWNSKIDLQNIEYLNDHVVQDTVVYPGAAYVEMALASQKLMDLDFPYVVEEISFHSPLIFLDDFSPELQLIKKQNNEFEIYSKNPKNSDEWTLHASGRFGNAVINSSVISINDIKKHAVKILEKDDLYENFRMHGLEYGKTFRTIERVWRCDKESLSLIKIDNSLVWDMENYLVHPTILDACFQTVAASVIKGKFLPVGIDKISVFKYAESVSWAYSKIVKQNSDFVKGDVFLADKDGKIIAEVHGLLCKRIVENSDFISNSILDFLYKYEWRLQPLEENDKPRNAAFFPSPEQLKKSVLPVVEKLTNKYSRLEYYKTVAPKLDKLCVEYIVHEFYKLGWNFDDLSPISSEELAEQLDVIPDQFKLFERFLAILSENNILKRTDKKWEVLETPENIKPEKSLNLLLNEHPAYLAEITFIQRCGSKIKEVFQGKTDPLSLIFAPGTSLPEHLYQHSPSLMIYNQLVRKTVKKILESLPEGKKIRILEVGAGTGSLTSFILPELPAGRTEYVFTDISQAFLNQAKETFKNYKFIDYKIYDLEKNPLNQKFLRHSFDIVIASNTIHATSDICRTLKNLKKLLAVNGMVMLLELTNPLYWFDLSFGMLKGWWLFNDFQLRSDHATLSQKDWLNVFNNCGFLETVCIYDKFDKFDALHSVIIARGPKINKNSVIKKIESPNKKNERPFLVIVDNENSSNEIFEKLQQENITVFKLVKGMSFKSLYKNCFQFKPDSHESINKIFEVTNCNEEKSPIVIDLSNIKFNKTEPDIQTIMLSTNLECEQIMFFVQALIKKKWGIPPELWIVTNGAQQIGQQESIAIEQTPLLGFGRSIISEILNLKTRLVDLGSAPADKEFSALVKEIISNSPEDEIAFRDNNRYVHRFVKAEELNKISSLITKHKYYSLEKSNSKHLEKFAFIEKEQQILKPDEVELEMYAAGVNFKDVANMSGMLDKLKFDENITLGLEGSGIVSRVGKNVKMFRVGDEVTGLVSSSFSNFAITRQELIIHKPSHLNFDEAATIPSAFLTSYYSLCTLAKIRKGERVLIHSATGGVGLAAIQIAREAGADIFATAGSPEKRSFLSSMGIKYVGDSRSLNFVDEIKIITKNMGIDIILNTLTGDAINGGISILKPVTGRFIDISNIHYQESLKFNSLRQGVSLFAFDLQAIISKNIDSIKLLFSELKKKFNNKIFFPLPHRTFPLTNVSDALTNMAKAKHIGKLVVSMRPSEIVPVPTNDKINLCADATYLITGGLGGLGLAAANWMASCGAKNIVLVSRNDNTDDVQKNSLEKLREIGVNVKVVTADVISEKQLQKTFYYVEKNMPPIKGVIHAAMVLKDGLLADMTSTQLKEVLNPKIVGAWNLHLLTKHKNLDFFICFSSFVSAIGNDGQTNYSAANSFLDSLAYYRNSIGLPALTIGWGAIAEAGYVAQNKVIKNLLQQQGLTAISLAQVWKIIKFCIENNVGYAGAALVDWHKIKKVSRVIFKSPRFSELLLSKQNDFNLNSQKNNLTKITLSTSIKDRKNFLTEILIKEVAGNLGVNPFKLNVEQSLDSLGFDSLMAVELSLRIEKVLGVTMPKMVLLQTVLTVSKLVDMIDKELPEKAHIIVENSKIEKDVLVERKSKTENINIEKRAFGFPDEYIELKNKFEQSDNADISSVYFNVSEGINNNITRINGKEYINYSSYNYLGLSGEPEVSKAAEKAVLKYGTSVSASRIASGERPFHRELETELSNLIGAEDSIVFVSGFGTNESIVGHLLGPGDAIFYDSLIHASVQQGAKLSGAKTFPFPHNKHNVLREILNSERKKYRYALIVIEGVYSMDGDIPELPEFIDIKNNHNTLLMVDEAHSLGVLGKTGRGIGEFYHINPDDVDLWMGTLSKSLAACGGYIAGSFEMIKYLKFTTPGFVYSVGMTPPDAAAALAAIRVLKKEPDRVARLHDRANMFLKLANEHGINTGLSKNSAVIPVMTNSTEQCFRLYKELFEQGIYALPVMYPVVPENASRVRFFISSTHTEKQIVETVSVIASILEINKNK